MRLTCPGCGAHGSIEHFSADAVARQTLELLSQLPAGLPAQTLRYMALFRPPHRGLTWDRAQRLAGEVLDMVRAEQVEWKGKTYTVKPDAFRHAMESLQNQRERLTLPMQSHGYLRSMLAAHAPRLAAAEEAAAEAGKRAASAARGASELTLFEKQMRVRLTEQAAAGDAGAKAQLEALDQGKEASS